MVSRYSRQEPETFFTPLKNQKIELSSRGFFELLHSRICQNGATHFRKLNEQYFFRVYVLHPLEEIQDSLDNRDQKTEWDADKIIDLAHGLDTHQSTSSSSSIPWELMACRPEHSEGGSLLTQRCLMAPAPAQFNCAPRDMSRILIICVICSATAGVCRISCLV